MSTIDISSKAVGPAGDLSNFTVWREGFVFRNQRFVCMEALLQGLKVFDHGQQNEIFRLEDGKLAKEMGAEHNTTWQANQLLWFREQPFRREEERYQILLDAAYQSLFNQNPYFRDCLEATNGLDLTHSIGESDPTKTVLTEKEFCDRLTRLRSGENLHSAPEQFC